MSAGVLARTRLSTPHAAIVLAGVLLLWRGISRMLGAELWAEDGQVFVHEALQYGVPSIFWPMGGYFHVIQRVVAVFWIAVAPLAWLATLICISAFAILVLIFATVAREDYAWLYPSRSARLVLVAMLCLGPGLGEVAGNLCNLNWVMFLRLALIGLKDPRRRLGAWDVALAVPLLLSTAGTPLLVPLFLWRAYQTRGRWDAAMLGLLALSIGAAANVATDPRALPPIGEAISFVLNYWFVSFYLRPWFGEIWTVTLSRPGWLSVGLKAVAVGVTAWLAYRYRRERSFQALALLTLPWAAWLLLTFIGRTGGVILWGPVNAIDANTWIHRWSFPAGVASSLFWMGILAARPRWFRAQPLLVSVFLIGNLLVPMDHFHLRPYGTERRWKTQVPLLERAIRTGDPAEVWIKTYPSPWGVYYKAKQKD